MWKAPPDVRGEWRGRIWALSGEGVATTHFVVEPLGMRLVDIRLVDDPALTTVLPDLLRFPAFGQRALSAVKDLPGNTGMFVLSRGPTKEAHVLTLPPG